MQLRPYQSAAVSAILQALRDGHNPAAQLPTGSGKSLVIAELTSTLRKKDGTVWILAHVQELITQNHRMYTKNYKDPSVGIICSGLNLRQTEQAVTFATIQSIIGPAREGLLKPPDLIIIDECHRIPHNNGDTSQFEALFSLYPDARRVGMSATPWRLDNGLVYGKGEQFWFDTLCYNYSVPQAVADGWLSPLVGVETETQLELPTSPLTGDFNNTEVSDLIVKDWLKSVAEAMSTLASKRQHIAVYCPTVVSAMRTAAIIHNVTGWTTAVVSGSMTKAERADTLWRFHQGDIRVLVSVETLTTGWDMPELDCIVCLRPTTSSSLWVQIMGRGTRLSPGKKNCLILDFVGNLQRLGGVDMIETYVRQSAPLEPLEALPAAPREPRRVLPGVRTLAVIDPTSGEQARDGAQLTVEVHAVSAVAIPTRRDPTKPVLMVTYACTTVEGARIDATAFIETEGASVEAQHFFNQRRLAVTLPIEARKVQWMMKGAAQPIYITVVKQGKYWNCTSEQFSTGENHE